MPVCSRCLVPWVAVLLTVGVAGSALAQTNPVYRCPGNLYTDQYTAKEAQDKGCRTIDGAPITVIASRPRAGPSAQSATAPSGGGGAGNARVDPAEQRSRDSDARRILEAELRKEEERLATLQKEFNGGEPERRGDERNFQKYVERVADMRAAIARKESDIAAIKREMAKLPAGGG